MPREEGREKLLGGTPLPLGWNWACSHGVCASTEGGYALSNTGPWGLLRLGQLSGSESVALAVPRVNGGLCLPGHDLRPCIKGCQQGRALGPELGQWTGCWGMGCWAGHRAWTPLETSKWHGTLQSSARRVPSPLALRLCSGHCWFKAEQPPCSQLHRCHQVGTLGAGGPLGTAGGAP